MGGYGAAIGWGVWGEWGYGVGFGVCYGVGCGAAPWCCGVAP